ncbi:methyltransferase domain-containing protein [Nocardia beijingensis]|uniref:methyltransferase domain-containing protein n=1 Tax=Nocardia beijingensis TaxID=95162 RepID=UPI00344C4EAE
MTGTNGRSTSHLPAGPLEILDVGGGNGLDARELAARGHHVTIADISEQSLAEARVPGPRTAAWTTASPPATPASMSSVTSSVAIVSMYCCATALSSTCLTLLR